MGDRDSREDCVWGMKCGLWSRRWTQVRRNEWDEDRECSLKAQNILWRNIGSAAFLIERFLVEIEICCVARPSHRIQSSKFKPTGPSITWSNGDTRGSEYRWWNRSRDPEIIYRWHCQPDKIVGEWNKGSIKTITYLNLHQDHEIRDPTVDTRTNSYDCKNQRQHR